MLQRHSMVTYSLRTPPPNKVLVGKLNLDFASLWLYTRKLKGNVQTCLKLKIDALKFPAKNSKKYKWHNYLDAGISRRLCMAPLDLDSCTYTLDHSKKKSALFSHSPISALFWFYPSDFRVFWPLAPFKLPTFFMDGPSYRTCNDVDFPAGGRAKHWTERT